MPNMTNMFNTIAWMLLTACLLRIFKIWKSREKLTYYSEVCDF